MKPAHVLTLGILGAFVAGSSLTVLLSSQFDATTLSGSLLEDSSSSVATSGCGAHEECEAGNVCRLGTCVASERSFCSQPFVLAQSVEGRFIRYTTCDNTCVRVDENTATCQ